MDLVCSLAQAQGTKANDLKRSADIVGGRSSLLDRNPGIRYDTRQTVCSTRVTAGRLREIAGSRKYVEGPVVLQQ